MQNMQNKNKIVQICKKGFNKEELHCLTLQISSYKNLNRQTNAESGKIQNHRDECPQPWEFHREDEKATNLQNFCFCSHQRKPIEDKRSDFYITLIPKPKGK